MSPIYKAAIKLLLNPIQNYKKILPYTRSYLDRKKRIFSEILGYDKYSKPYDGHEDLLDIINYDNGFFVECGGFDGVAFDPTYYLEKFKNWKGIIIEPIPKWSKICQKNRPASRIVQAALTSKDYTSNEIELINCDMMSVTKDTQYDIDKWIKAGEEAQKIQATTITVPAKTLDQVLKETETENRIDLLVIDVEGSESEVLKGLSIERYKPTYVLAEMSKPEQVKTFETILGTKYSFIKKISFSDYLYRLETKKNLD